MAARVVRTDARALLPSVPSTQISLVLSPRSHPMVSMVEFVINHVRGTVKSFGERIPKCRAETFARRTRDLVPAVLKAALDPIYATLETLEQQIKEHDQMIERVAKRYPDVEVVSQVPGVGTLIGLVYVLTIEDKERFTKSRLVGAYLGLRPRKSASGNDDPQLHITKAGDPFLRRLLVNGAQYIMGPFGKDTDLRRWGLELAKRGGKNARKRAVVAVARKLAVLLHRLWVTGEVYQPNGYGTRAVEQPAA